MLYPKNKSPKLEDSLFQNPTSEYRGAPFWAWNNKLDKDQLCRQIENMKQMGFGGYHMHSRSGMDTPYLGDEFMDAVKACVEKGKEEHMLSWLYDEDRWPSGHAGGKVTADPAFAQRALLLSPEGPGQGDFLCAYDIVLDENNCLASYRRMGKDDTATGTKWYASVTITKNRKDCNGNPYVDTLNPKAIERFTEITHDRYKEVVGKDFGGAVPASFSDEPQISQQKFLPFAADKKAVSLPWTPTLPQTFRETYGKDVLELLPEMIWQLPEGKVSQFRWQLHDHLAELFATAYADTLGGWCNQNGLMLTGHVLGEKSLLSQSKAVGECMRQYRSFTIPGIDILCNAYEYTTAKQAQSAVRQYGREAMMSELYGVTNWHFDFRGHKLQGDWQAALGVTVRVPHLYWVSMAGEAKRDYPAPIGHQSPWWKEYSYIEDHFARLNTALTRGKPICKIGVIHPIESYWLSMGPTDQTGDARLTQNQNFQDITQWLLLGQQDFDFISEALLPSLCKEGAYPLSVGEMAYDVIILPAMTTIRQTTLERLLAFQKAGGHIIVMGQAPSLADALPSSDASTLGQVIPFSEVALMEALEPYRLVDVRVSDSVKPDTYSAQIAKTAAPGTRSHDMVYQLRQDGDSRWCFICHGAAPEQLDTTYDKPVQIRLKGTWKPTEYDTLTGEIRPLGATYENGWTYMERVMHSCDSLLLRLEEGKAEAPAPICATDRSGTAIKGMVPVTLHEPNVLLLDMARYRMDEDEAWQDEEEVLKLDNICRLRFGYNKKQSVTLQPWAMEGASITHTIHMEFTFHSDLDLDGVKLALEDVELAAITLNGKPVPNAADGWYVDECIKTVPLPKIKQGDNVITVSLPFGERTNTEAMYLLGNFGVKVCGTYRTLTEHVTHLGFGCITWQGLPYYGGNITYHLPLNSTEDTELAIPHYRGSLMTVAAAGQNYGKLVFPPYRMALRNIPKDAKTIDVTLFGNRANTFGALHNWDPATRWWGPGVGRIDRDAWGYEYNLRPTGILTGPTLRKL